MKQNEFKCLDALPSTLSFILFIAQLVYGFYFVENENIIILEYTGVGIFILSGVFGLAPVIVFPRRGGAGKGMDFIHTKKIVTTGIYSIVRHPQYSSFMLWAFGSMFIFHDFIIVLLGIPIIILTYFDMIQEDKRNIKKFGESYKNYIKKVPRANFLWGLIRYLIG